MSEWNLSDEVRELFEAYKNECDACFDIAQRLDSENPGVSNSFADVPSVRIKKQLRAIGVKGFSDVKLGSDISEYHKIQTIFKRDMTSQRKSLIEGEWTTPEFEYLSLNEWEFTEKVDGTNIRIMIGDGKIEFGGRTANASIPAPLVARLNERFLPQTDILLAKFLDGAVLYGEGYGAKIQKVGGNYRQDQDFVLFDVKVGDWWLRRTDVEEVAIDLGLDVVPVVGRGDLFAAMSMVRSGMRSTWGDFEAEGIVARPTVDLKMQNGSRIITKIKCRDFA